MSRGPRSSKKLLVGKHIIFRTVWVTAVLVVAIIGSFRWAHVPRAMTITAIRAVPDDGRGMSNWLAEHEQIAAHEPIAQVT